MFKRTFFTVAALAISTALAGCGAGAESDDDTAPEELALEDELDTQGGGLTTPEPRPDPEPMWTCSLGEGWCKCTGVKSCDSLKQKCEDAHGKYVPGAPTPGGLPTGTCYY